jgi:hypothetical protein
MFRLLPLFFGLALRAFRSRRDLRTENLVLRPQLLALKRRHCRPKRAPVDQ